MTIYIYSQKEAIRKYVHRYLSSDLESTEVDIVVRDSLSELVRLHMREVAVNQVEKALLWDDLIEQAVSLARTELSNIGGSRSSSRLRTLNSCLPPIKKELESIAKEIAKLQNARVRVNDPFDEKPQLAVDSVDASQVALLGSPDNIRGFFIPLPNSTDAAGLDLEAVHSFATVRGEWFPFEIEIWETTVVLDDDGSLYVSTENLPSNLVKTSYESIQRIAEAIYVTPE